MVAAMHALPHMLQYLVMRLSGGKDHLTTNGSKKELWEINHQILEIVGQEQDDKEDPFKNQANWYNRILWLSYYFYPVTRASRKSSRFGLAVRLALLGVILFGVGYKIYESITFAEVYDARIQAQIEALEEGNEKPAQAGDQVPSSQQVGQPERKAEDKAVK